MKTKSLRRQVSRLVIAVTLFATPVLFSGCIVAAAGVGAGAVAWYKGELKANLTQSVSDVNHAVEKTIDKLQLFKISAKSDMLSGDFVVRNARDEKITILVAKNGDGVTVLRIRVGVFGDEVMSRSVLEEVKKNL